MKTAVQYSRFQKLRHEIKHRMKKNRKEVTKEERMVRGKECMMVVVRDCSSKQQLKGIEHSPCVNVKLGFSILNFNIV